jgi:hypothetical protein
LSPCLNLLERVQSSFSHSHWFEEWVWRFVPDAGASGFLIGVLERFLQGGDGRLIADSAERHDCIDANLYVCVVKRLDEKWNGVFVAMLA